MGSVEPVTDEIAWPENPPVLQVGRTLFDAVDGMPDVRYQATAEIAFQGSDTGSNNSMEFADATALAKLFNPLAVRTVPTGETVAFGGDVMMRRVALEAVGGYDPDTIVGEEAETGIRLQREGWRSWQLVDEMTLHDVAMTQFRQWWRRARRGGYGYGEAVALYGAPPERHKVVESRRALFWGLAVPGVAVLGAFVTPWALLLLLAWPLQVLRLILRGTPPLQAVFLMVGKVPEALGILEFWIKRRLLRTAERIDYK